MANVVPTGRQRSFRLPSVRALIVTAGLLLMAVVTANLDIGTATVSRRVIVQGAIPWGLQVVAILVFFAGCSGSQSRCPPEVVFAGAITVAIGLTWWLANICAYAGLSPIEAVLQAVETSVAQQFAGESLLFTLSHRVCGPLMSVFQFRGLLSLEGVAFIDSLGSLFVIIGYLFVTASVCGVGQPGRARVRDYIKFTLLMVVVFTPSIIRLVIDANAVGGVEFEAQTRTEMRERNGFATR